MGILGSPPRLYSSSPEGVECGNYRLLPLPTPRFACSLPRSKYNARLRVPVWREVGLMKRRGRELQYLREQRYFSIPSCRMALRSLLNLYQCCVERLLSWKLSLPDRSRLLSSLDSPFFSIKVMKTKVLMLQKCNSSAREWQGRALNAVGY